MAVGFTAMAAAVGSTAGGVEVREGPSVVGTADRSAATGAEVLRPGSDGGLSFALVVCEGATGAA